MDVAGAWRCVEDEIVEFAPVGIGDELFQRIRGHAAAPEGGGSGGDEETNRQELDTILLDGDNDRSY